MDGNVYKAVMNDKPDALTNCSPDKIALLTPNDNTVLHVAAEFGSHKCVKDLLSNYPTLLRLTNKNGDTPLHSALAGTRDNGRKFLDSFIESATSLDGGATAVREMLRARNAEGDTPLHLAARRSSTTSAADILKLLLQRYPEELDHGLNEAGETPLYLYVERGDDVEVLSEMLKTCTIQNEYHGPLRRTALHAAVIHRKVKFLDVLIEWKKDMIKETDANGRTPLHYAAENGNVKAVKKLLAADESVAYVPVNKPLPNDESVASSTANYDDDEGNTSSTLHVAIAKGDTKAGTANNDEGSTALHLATAKGDTRVMRELLTKCPDCWEMVNGEGQTILHISVDSERHWATSYISKQPWVWCLVNRKDHAGHTPMHLIAHKRNLLYLIISMKTLTDEFWSSDNILPKFTCCWLLQNKFLGRSNDKGQGGEEQKQGQMSEVQMILATFNREYKKQKAGEDMTKMAETHMLVATLISTITFAAGFTIPGGYDQDKGSNQGMAVLVRAAAFKAFVITNTVALICSTSSVFLYVSASLFNNVNAGGHGEERRAHRYEIAFWLILIALLAMMVAFGTGAYAVLANSSGLAIATCAVACSSFIVYAFELTKHFAGEIAYVGFYLVLGAFVVVFAGLVLLPVFCISFVVGCCCCCVIGYWEYRKQKKASLTERGDDGPSQSSNSQV